MLVNRSCYLNYHSDSDGPNKGRRLYFYMQQFCPSGRPKGLYGRTAQVLKAFHCNLNLVIGKVVKKKAAS